MDEKGKNMIVDSNRIFKKIFKSILCTLTMFVISIWGIYSILEFVFGEMPVEQSDRCLILSLEIAIIFTIFYCTFTILEELKK